MRYINHRTKRFLDNAATRRPIPGVEPFLERIARWRWYPLALLAAAVAIGLTTAVPLVLVLGDVHAWNTYPGHARTLVFALTGASTAFAALMILAWIMERPVVATLRESLEELKLLDPDALTQLRHVHGLTQDGTK